MDVKNRVGIKIKKWHVEREKTSSIRHDWIRKWVQRHDNQRGSLIVVPLLEIVDGLDLERGKLQTPSCFGIWIKK